jgi:hypothetical protein
LTKIKKLIEVGFIGGAFLCGLDHQLPKSNFKIKRVKAFMEAIFFMKPCTHEFAKGEGFQRIIGEGDSKT